MGLIGVGLTILVAGLLFLRLQKGNVESPLTEKVAEIKEAQPPAQYARAATDAELKAIPQCTDVFDLSQAGQSLRALIFREGELSWRIVFYRLEQESFVLMATNVFDGFEPPFLRNTGQPQVTLRHHEYRLTWTSHYDRKKGFSMDADDKAVENGVHYTLGPSEPVNKAQFARDVLKDEVFARELERGEAAEAGARRPR